MSSDTLHLNKTEIIRFVGDGINFQVFNSGNATNILASTISPADQLELLSLTNQVDGSILATLRLSKKAKIEAIRTTAGQTVPHVNNSDGSISVVINPTSSIINLIAYYREGTRLIQSTPVTIGLIQDEGCSVELIILSITRDTEDPRRHVIDMMGTPSAKVYLQYPSSPFPDPGEFLNWIGTNGHFTLIQYIQPNLTYTLTAISGTNTATSSFIISTT